MKQDFCSTKFKALLMTSTFTLAIQYLMLLSDNFIVGNVVGQEAMAAMSFITPLATIVSFISLVNSVGTTICRSRMLGDFQKKRADEFYSQGLIIAIVSGILMFLLLYLGKDFYFNSFGASDSVTAHAMSYCKFYMFLVLVSPLNSFLSNIILAEGEVFLCNLSYIVQIFGNILLSLIFALRIGVGGAALGSLVTVLLNMGILGLHYFKKDNQLKFIWHFSIADFRQAAQRSIADAVSNLLWAIQFSVYSKFVIRMYGDRYLPALSVMINVIQFTMIFRGIGMGMRSFISVYMSEKNTKGMRRLMKTVSKTTVLESLGVSCFFLLAAGLIPYGFGIRDEAVLAMTAKCIRFLAITLICYAGGFMFSAYYLTVDKRSFAWVITLLKEFFAPILCGLSFGIAFKGMGIAGMSVGLSVGSFLGLTLSMLYVCMRKGKESFPFLLDSSREELIFAETLLLTPENLVPVLDHIEQFLEEKKVPEKSKAKLRLIAEEVGMEIYSQNKDRDVLAEYVVDLNEGLKLILRDDGKIMNITDADASITSFRTFILASIMEHHPDRFNIVNTGYNRNAFIFGEKRVRRTGKE